MIAELTDRIAAEQRLAGRPIVVGVSGYGGSGKSTLARRIVAAVPGAVRMRGDDFLDPVRSHRRSTDWDGVERERLVTEVLTPFRESRASTFRRFDWGVRALGAPEPVPVADVMVVDLIGLFHPDASPALDVAVWCDVDLATATSRGMARDADLGRRHDALWNEVWVPNERDFEARFAPRDRADLLVDVRIDTASTPAGAEAAGTGSGASWTVRGMLLPVTTPRSFHSTDVRAAMSDGVATRAR
ncbi:uridine kinase [Sediminihabitans luteus]|uniref:Uridine kinase n=1 Tax=Sediminihabitans luteus TaxID=1138585 RepID=A0A2M9D0T0_9CELL|nr:phosphoglycerate transporter [Sediminihabitans luteus]PJJ77804.1 uridine kinase [Sediminihabitans luteus]GII99838.1 uridine kinase [Sediminihabitans luteus]